VDAINGFILEDGTIFQEMYEILEEYPNRKIVLTGANDEVFEKFNLGKLPYEVFTLKHNPEKSDPSYFKIFLEKFNLKPKDVIYFEHNIEAMKSAESLGIKSYFYDHTKEDLSALKQFIDSNIS
jgi:HAD superfamily hydrolase (TIGR01509 family)